MRVPLQVEIDCCNNCKLEICSETDARCGLRKLKEWRMVSAIKYPDDQLKRDIIAILGKLRNEQPQA